MPVSVLLAVWVLGSVAVPVTAVPNNPGPTILFTNGQPLDELRGASILAPKGEVTDLSLTLSAVTLQPFVTNMHTHGLHSSPGVFKQDPNAPYTGADNIFYELNPCPASSSESDANFINYQVSVPKFHSPGMFCYHPHFHGSSGLQTVSANGILIIEDDPEWLPEEWLPVVDKMVSAKDVMLHLGIYNFLPPITSFPGANAGLDDTSIPVWSQLSDPKNPLCCGNSTTANTEQGPLLASGSALKNDTLMLNGGYQPVMTMESGVYQRWRVLHTGYKNWVDVQILDVKTKAPSDDCELLLVAKDGIYLKNIPRVVDHIFLASGNRAELFVRCSLPANGKKIATGEYILASGIAPSPFCGANFTSMGLIQQEIATIRVTKPSSSAADSALTPEACTPLRSDYAPDLSDESLAAFNATDKLYQQDVSFTFGNQTYGCLVNDKNFSYPDAEPLKMPLGKVVEWPAFLDAAVHPLHTHIVPYQLIKLDSDFLSPGCSFTSWFQPGDWQDTLLLPMTAPNDTASDSNVLRMQPGPFTGYAVMPLLAP